MVKVQICMKNDNLIDIIHDFIIFTRFPINSKLGHVITHQLDCPNHLIIGYTRSLGHH